MATITEDYVSFEVAKLLKEKGFNEPCYTCYLSKEFSHYDYLSTNFELVDNAYSAPTLQMTMKWLRKVHNLSVEPYRTACGYLYTISTIPYGSCKCNPKEGGDDEDSGQWTTYEGACKNAIKYCLENLIK